MRILLMIIILSLAVTGCGEKHPREKIAVRIDDYTLTPSEFNDIYISSGTFDKTPAGREAFLKNLITRKLLLLEAQKKGVDRQKPFLKSIEDFWEQALLKIIIDMKAKEIADNIVVTEEEIRERYDKSAGRETGDSGDYEKMREVIKWQISKEKQRRAMDAWIESLKNKADIEVDKKAVGLE